MKTNTKKINQLTIAVTGMNARADNPGPGVAVARCLREVVGFTGKIIGLGYDVLDPGLFQTQLTDAGYLLPYPSAGEEELLHRLHYIQEREQIDVLIPCLDAEILSLIHLQEQIAELGIKMLLPTEAQLQCRNKDRLHQFANQTGIKTPEQTPITSSSFFYDCAKKGWTYPLVVKGQFYDAGIAHNPEQAVGLFHRIAAVWGMPILVQKLIEGDEVNLTGLGDGNGKLLGAVMMRKRAVTDKGKAWAGMTVHDAGLLNAAEKLVAGLKWSGPLEVEMMRDKHGDYYLIEINPRFPAWIYLAKASGNNLPWALLEILQQQPLSELTPPVAGTLFIRYAQETIVSLADFEAMMMNGERAVATL